jgi:hypothetical protein
VEMSELRDKRIKFTRLLAELIQWGNAQTGYEIALGRDFDEGHEPLHHMAGSLHYMGLANDLALYVDGVYQTETEQYKRLGDAWKSLDPDCCWGGDFEIVDGNHLSIKFGGKK